MRRKIVYFSLVLSIGITNLIQPANPLPQTQPYSYIVQAEDTLPRLADKFYQNPSTWPAIWLATNTIAAADPHFSPMDAPQVLQPGQRLLIPPPAEAERLQAEYLARADLITLTPSPDAQPLTAAWLAEFVAYVEEARRHFDIPGAALAVVRDNQIVLAQGFGVRELGQPEPVTPETVFGIGSTTKAMNSALIATLVDDGLLTWDQPATEIWPDFKLSDPAVTPQIRLRHLLNMSSGAPRADLAWSGRGLTAEEVMASLADLPILAPPGQSFHYNNQAVAAGGYLAALAAGGEYGRLQQAYAGLIRQRIFEPIGMRNTTFSIEAALSNPNHATPHDFTLAGETLPTYYHADPGIAPAGAANANALDMARFLLMQLNQGVAANGNRIVSTPNLRETWQPQIEAYSDTSYALGWFVESYQGVKMIWHDGDVLGFKSLLVFIPEARVGLVLLANRTISIGFSSSVRYRLVEQLYGLEAEASSQYKTQWDTFIEALPGIREPLEANPAPAEVAPYLGQYDGGWQVEQRDDGTLWTVRGPYQWQLLAENEADFVINNGFGLTSEIQFVTDETGQTTMEINLSTGEKGKYRRFGP
jgi:CubicO group peptidase (beta-lactamase class C family)